MNEIAMLGSGIIPTSRFGKLRIKAVVVNYDYPRVFVAQSDDKSLYLFSENCDDNSGFGWDAVMVSLEEIKGLNEGTVSFQSLMNNHPSFVVRDEGGETLTVASVQSGFDNEYPSTPESESFFPGFCDMDAAFDYHALGALADEENAYVYSVVERDSNIPIRRFEAIYGFFRKILNSLKNPIRSSEAKLAFAKGSTVISFVVPISEKEQSELLPQKQEAMNNFINVIRADDSIQIAASLGDKKANGALDACGKFMDSYLKEGGEATVVLTAPKSDSVLSYPLGKASIEKRRPIYEEATRIVRSKENIVVTRGVYRGVLKGIVVRENGEFTFYDYRTEQTIKGKADFSILSTSSQYDVNGPLYDASIECSHIGSKSSYVLKALKKVTDPETPVQETFL